jgi:hypothetical protein
MQRSEVTVQSFFSLKLKSSTEEEHIVRMEFDRHIFGIYKNGVLWYRLLVTINNIDARDVWS